MATWRLKFCGPLTLTRDGEPVKLRIRQQLLLLALIASREDMRVDRNDAANLLWPEAGRENALAYLRRALMELRKIGIEVGSSDGWLTLNSDQIDSDIDELLQEASVAAPSLDFFSHEEHPAADEIRLTLEDRIEEVRSGKLQDDDTERETEVIRAKLGDLLLKKEPQLAVKFLSQHVRPLMTDLSPEPSLNVMLQALSTGEGSLEDRQHLSRWSAVCAQYLTRYNMAERLYKEAAELAEKAGRIDEKALSLSGLSFLYMEQRKWDEALATAPTAIEAVDVHGDLEAMRAAYSIYGSILWHACQFEKAVYYYRRGIEFSEGRSIVDLANLAFLEGVFGVPSGMEFQRVLVPKYTEGYLSIGEAYLQFSVGLIDKSGAEACVGAARLLEYTVREEMERYFAVAVDTAAIALVLRGQADRATVLVRLGSRIRRDIGHRRSPAEYLAIRRNIPFPLFGQDKKSQYKRLKRKSMQDLAIELKTYLLPDESNREY